MKILSNFPFYTKLARLSIILTLAAFGNGLYSPFFKEQSVFSFLLMYFSSLFHFLKGLGAANDSTGKTKDHWWNSCVSFTLIITLSLINCL